MVPRKYAGYRLAGLPLENISGKVKEAAEVLRANATPLPDYEENIPVRGYEDSSVYMGAHQGYSSLFDQSEKIANSPNPLGNPQELQRIIDAKPAGILTLGWNIEGMGELDDKGRFLAARTAQKEFKRILADIPDGTVVQNSPVGGLDGDYTRADAYMTQGMGPLQTNGEQYAIMRNGQMEPLSPFVPMMEHAQHLADRAERGGQQEIADSIRLELNRRQKQNNTIPKRIRKAGDKINNKIRRTGFKLRNYINNDDGDRRGYRPKNYQDEDPRAQYRYDSEYEPSYVPPKSARARVNERDDAIWTNISTVVRDSTPEVSFDDRVRLNDTPIHVPEIQVRNWNKQQIAQNVNSTSPGRERINTSLEPGSISESLYRDAYPDVYIPTPEDINQIRQLQTELAMIPGGARRALDNIEAVRPRAAPPTLTIGDDGTIYGDRPFGSARTEYRVPEDPRYPHDARVSPHFVPDYTQIRDVARARAGLGYITTPQRRSNRVGARDPNAFRNAVIHPGIPSNPELINEVRQYQTILHEAQQRNPNIVAADTTRSSANPDINSLAQRPTLVDSIRDELGLRRRPSNDGWISAPLVPDTDDIPF